MSSTSPINHPTSNANMHTIVNANQLAENQNQQMQRNQAQDEQLQKLHHHQQQQQQQKQTSSIKKFHSKSPPKSPQRSFVTQHTKTEKISM